MPFVVCFVGLAAAMTVAAAAPAALTVAEFDPVDSTRILQAALDSGAQRLTIPYRGGPWITTPLQLRSNMEIVLEPGVVLLAKKGAFLGKGDSLLTANGVENLTIRGYGATLRMHKADYQKAPYEKAEWRMALSLRGVRNVTVLGLSAESSGGDGFYIDGNGSRAYSENVSFRDCTAHDNHRQGMSVISAVNLTVENCRFTGTRGTAPEAGIDLEPDAANQRLENITIRNCVFENNAGHHVLVYGKPLTRQSAPVSIRFENCLARGGGHAGFAVGAFGQDGPQGSIEFVNCVTENTGREGMKVYDKAVSGPGVTFRNCHFQNPWQAPAVEYGGPRVPILLQVRRAALTGTPGGVQLEQCTVYDTAERPVLQFDSEDSAPLTDVSVTLRAPRAKTPRARLGTATSRVSVKFE